MSMLLSPYIKAPSGPVLVTGTTWSNGTYLLTSTGTPYTNIKSTSAKTTGKYYWEISCDQMSGYERYGFGSGLPTGSNFIGDDAGGISFGIYPLNGQTRYKATNGFPTLGGGAINDVYQFVIDLTNGFYAIGKKNQNVKSTNVNSFSSEIDANGIAGVYGYALVSPLLGVSMYIEASAPQTAGKRVKLMTSTADWIYTPPIGYAAWA